LRLCPGGEEDAVELTLSILAVLFAGGSVLFSAVQTRHLARQTAVVGSAAELSFNVEIMARLDSVLRTIAEDEATFERFWAQGREEHDRMGVAIQALLDALCMASAATGRLPGFELNAADWDAYTRYVLRSSPVVRQFLDEHLDWWPELRRFATPQVEAGATRS
jgi:hypothetical protein